MLKTFRNSRGSGGWTSSGGLERERGGIGSNHPNLNLDQRGRSSGTCTFSAMGEAVKPVPDRPPSLELLWLLGSSPPPPGAATPTARVAAAASRAYSSSWCRRRRTGGEGSGHGVGGGSRPGGSEGRVRSPPSPAAPSPCATQLRDSYTQTLRQRPLPPPRVMMGGSGRDAWVGARLGSDT